MATLPPIDPETRARTIRRESLRLVLFLLIVAVIPALVELGNWLNLRSYRGLAALRPGDVSRVTVSDYSGYTPGVVFVSFDAQSKPQVVNDLIAALASTSEHSPSREDIGPRNVLMVLYLTNGRTMQLSIHKNDACGPTLYIDIIRRLGRSAELHLGGAESDTKLGRWFEQTSLTPHLGCP